MNAPVPSTQQNPPLYNQRHYDSLDALKCICAFLVITIHVPFRGLLGHYCKAIARLAVPVFFMISGFFMEERYAQSRPPSVKKNAAKLLKLIFWCNVLYFAWGILFYRFYEQTRSLTRLFMYFTGGENWPDKLKNYVLFHDHLAYEEVHLWYLNALLYAWTIVCCVKRFFKENGNKLLYLLIPLLLAYAVAQSNYSYLLFRTHNPLLSRNFLFCGIPFISLGSWVYQKQKHLYPLFSKRGLCILVLVLTAGVCLEERALYYFRNFNPADYYICTAFQALAVFLLFLKIHHDCAGASWVKPLAIIGKRHSLLIYILHPILHTVTLTVITRLKADELYNYVNIEPILVFILTLITSELLLRIRQIKSRIRPSVRSL